MRFGKGFKHCLFLLGGLAFFMFCLPPAMAAGDAAVSGPQQPDMPVDENVGNLMLNNAEIQDVLRLIADEYDLNIVISENVTGTVTLRLKGTSLINTLDSILLSRGYDYEIRDNIIRVAPADVIEAERGQRLAKLGLEPLVPEVIALRYLDANDLKPIVESMLTDRGSVKVLERRAYKGFRFGTESSSSGGSSQSSSSGQSSVSSAGDFGGLIRSRAGSEEESPRSNTLLVVDVRSQIEKIRKVITDVDIAPRQVLIDAKILEVDTDTLEDLGIDFNSETSFTVSEGRSNLWTTDVNSDASDTGINANIFADDFPAATDAGIHTVFQRLNGEDFTVTLHALLQDERTKTLSAPKIMTIENQEAAILVGEQFPIFEANVTDQGTTTETLSFFQPIGISLQVIVQVTPHNDVSMIIHPTVSSIGQFVTGTSGLTQPRINIREADTRVLIKNGETLVIGGLLHDVMDEKVFGIPLLRKVPLLGKLFTRRQVDVDQRNLMIFITPHILDLKDSLLSEAEENTLKGIEDPARYGFLHNRRETIGKIYEAAKKNYKNKHDVIAQEQFLRVYRLDPHHEGAIKYLKKLNALPDERPLG